MPTNLINLCTKGTMSFSLCLSCRKSNIRFFYASCGSTHSIEFALQIHKFRSMYLGDLYKGKKRTRFPSDSPESVVFERTRFGKRSFSTASGTMSFSLCLLGLCNFCLADNHTDQRIKFIIVRGRLSGGSIPALSITLSIHAILRPSFSMTSTPSISCTASPLSAPCTAFQ